MIWERRWHPLREEWVTITSHRQMRPWSGANATQRDVTAPSYVDNCYLCPGNERISGAINDQYEDIFVFDNDHPAFGTQAPARPSNAPGIYRNAPAIGTCRVVCYSPDHSQTLAELGADRTKQVLACWAEESAALARMPGISSVLVFENKGEIVGVSNPHPHCQIYAPGFVFPAIERENQSMVDYLERTGRGLFEDIIATEAEDGRRVIAGNEHAIAFVPWFARFPYELYIAPRGRFSSLDQIDDDTMAGLAAVLSEALVRLDNLWQQSFPYMLIVHQAPCDGRDTGGYHCHIQVHPPLRAPGLQKFLAGVETGGGHFLNDTDPDEKAAELRAVPALHYNAFRAQR